MRTVQEIESYYQHQIQGCLRPLLPKIIMDPNTVKD